MTLYTVAPSTSTGAPRMLPWPLFHGKEEEEEEELRRFSRAYLGLASETPIRKRRAKVVKNAVASLMI